jgi:hypothetical protein
MRARSVTVCAVDNIEPSSGLIQRTPGSQRKEGFMSTLDNLVIRDNLREPGLVSHCGGMPLLERVSLSGCAGITNAGVAALAGLPRLREVNLDGLRNVTPEAAALFPAGVRVKMST